MLFTSCSLQACLSAIIVVALRGMMMQFVDFPGFWKKDMFDGLLWIGTFLGVILLDVDL